jgi:hypothetical protein
MMFEEEQMIRKCLAIGISTVSVLLLVLGSLSNVVGFQTVQSSQQNIIKESINKRELLFQTIVDIANNKEIQRIILRSQMSRGIFPTSDKPVVTKNQLKIMYFFGLILSKVISKSRIQSIVGKYQFNNQEIQKEISAVIEKDTTINAEISQLKNSECDCENENRIDWHFPIICAFLNITWLACFYFSMLIGDRIILDGSILVFIGTVLYYIALVNCI